MTRMEIDLPVSWHFTTEIPIRISDINYSNHLGNDSILSLMHEARVRMFAAHGWGELDIAGKGIIMADAAVVFRSEAFYGDVAIVDLAVGDPESRSCNVFYRLTSKETGKEIARARTALIFFDYAARKPVTMPDTFRKAFFSEK